MESNFRNPCFYTLVLILLLVFSTISAAYSKAYSAASARISRVPYSDHCASVVPEASPTFYDLSALPFLRPTTTHYTGGDKILGKNSSQFSLYDKYLSFSVGRHVHATNVTGVYKIEGYMKFRSSSMYYLSSDATYGQSSYTRVRPRSGVLSFLLNGFWSETSGKICMVGSATWRTREGNFLNLDAVLKLNYAKNSTIFTSLVSGKLESLSSPDDTSYFDPISILAFPQMSRYEYKLVSDQEFDGGSSGGFDIPQNPSLSLGPRGICYMFQNRFGTYKLEYASTCRSLHNCNLLEGAGYMPSTMYLNAIQCSEVEKKLRFMIRFTNSSYVGYHQMFEPNTTLVGEGSWDGKRNRLRIVACRIFQSTDSLGNDHIGDCSIRLNLWFPAVLSIRNTSSVEGQIWSNKTAVDAGYFERISFQGSNNNVVDVPGLKYKYTEIDRVKRLCLKKPVKTKGERYQSGHSYDMRFDMSVKTSAGNFGWGDAVPISVGDQLYGQYPVIMSESQWGEAVENEGPVVDTSYAPLNISYKLGLSELDGKKLEGRFSSLNLSLNPYGRIEITAEGVYNPATGYLCMVGCRSLGFYTGIPTNDSLDCEILVSFQFPPENGRDGGFTKGSIKSTRKTTDPLYFDDLNMSSTAYSTNEAERSIWRMDIEITMVLISNTLACVFVGLQLYYVRRYPSSVPYISLVMLGILTLGHMIPLVLNFEALFLESRNRQNVLLGNAGWLEVNEVIVRVVTMVAFLLQFRLLQLAWTARLGEGKEKSIWISEKKTLLVCFPLYILGALIAFFMNWSKNKYGGYVSHSSLVSVYQRHSLWGDLRSYAGLVLDCFLLPQILLNMFQMSRESALSPSFYLGTTSVRLVPHAYDLYRDHNYVPSHFNGSYIYANPSADFYSTAWDIIIPCGGILFALIIYLQQRFGGRFFLPRRFRESEVYEKVPAVVGIE